LATASEIATEPILFEMGSGNVFADIDLPNPELCQAKALLTHAVYLLIKASGMTPAKVAAKLGVEVRAVKAILKGDDEEYTVDQLFHFLTALGQRIDISIQADPTLNRNDSIHVQFPFNTNDSLCNEDGEC